MVIVNYLFMCFIFGTTFLAIKIGVDSGLPPFFSAGFRFFIAGFLLFIIMLWKKKTTIGILLNKEFLFTGIGLTFGTFSTLYWAEQYVTSGVAAVLSAMGPIMILFMQSAILRQKVNRLSFIGCFVGVIGVIFLLLPNLTVKTNSFWIYGCLAIVLGEVFYALGTIYAKSTITKFQGTSPIILNAAQMMYGGVLLIILSIATERGHFDMNLTLASIGSLVYLVVFGSMIGHSLFYWLVAKTNPVFPSTWLFISPIIALLVGIVFYGEHITSSTVIGTFIIILGTILVNFHSILDMKKSFMQPAK